MYTFFEKWSDICKFRTIKKFIFAEGEVFTNYSPKYLQITSAKIKIFFNSLTLLNYLWSI